MITLPWDAIDKSERFEGSYFHKNIKIMCNFHNYL